MRWRPSAELRVGQHTQAPTSLSDLVNLHLLLPSPMSALATEALTLCGALCLLLCARPHLTLFQVLEGDGTLVPVLHARHPGSGERGNLLRPHTLYGQSWDLNRPHAQPPVPHCTLNRGTVPQVCLLTGEQNSAARGVDGYTDCNYPRVSCPQGSPP